MDQGGFTYADGHFWGAGGDPNLVVEIDPTSGAVVKRISPTLADVGAYAVRGGTLWEVGGTALVKIDIRGGKEIDRYMLPSGDPNQTGIAVADGSLWVTRAGAGVNEVLKIDPDNGRVARRYPGCSRPDRHRGRQRDGVDRVPFQWRDGTQSGHGADKAGGDTARSTQIRRRGRWLWLGRGRGQGRGVQD